MARIEKTVFISYRRTNFPWALAIYQNLTQNGYDVFFDYESINSGDFERIIVGNIKARAHFIVILTPSALERCDNPDDWLRREIETALDNKRNIIPLMLEGFNFGSPSISKYLTGKLEMLKKYNGLNVPVDYFDEAMARLRDKYLNVALDVVLHPLSSSASKAVREQQIAANRATQVKSRELNAQEWFEQGQRQSEAKKYEEAIQCYTEAIRLQPDYALAYGNRGYVIIESQGNLEQALRDLGQAIQLQPDQYASYNNRGRIYQKQGKPDQAMTEYNLSIKHNPSYHYPYYNRGILRYEQGNLDGAIKDYNEALRLKPDYVDAYNNRGIARKGKGDVEGAIKDYSEAIRLKPDYTDAYYNRGLAWYHKNDWDRAIKDFTEALRLYPAHQNSYWSRGSCWFNKGDYYSAIADYQKYFDLGGTDEKVRQYLNDAKKKIKK